MQQPSTNGNAQAFGDDRMLVAAFGKLKTNRAFQEPRSRPLNETGRAARFRRVQKTLPILPKLKQAISMLSAIMSAHTGVDTPQVENSTFHDGPLGIGTGTVQRIAAGPFEAKQSRVIRRPVHSSRCVHSGLPNSRLGRFVAHDGGQWRYFERIRSAIAVDSWSARSKALWFSLIAKLHSVWQQTGNGRSLKRIEVNKYDRSCSEGAQANSSLSLSNSKFAV